MFMLISFGAAT